MSYPQMVTIGLYGRDEASFFQALVDAQVDLFCDIRQRRGVRGAQYAFANSVRLQARLAELDIAYVHHKELAPTTQVRQVQKEADKIGQTAKRLRDGLSPAFVAAYSRACLSNFSAATFLRELPANAQVIAFFCVEAAPEACHRSLVAEAIAQQLAVKVHHL